MIMQHPRSSLPPLSTLPVQDEDIMINRLSIDWDLAMHCSPYGSSVLPACRVCTCFAWSALLAAMPKQQQQQQHISTLHTWAHCCHCSLRVLHAYMPQLVRPIASYWLTPVDQLLSPYWFCQPVQRVRQASECGCACLLPPAAQQPAAQQQRQQQQHVF